MENKCQLIWTNTPSLKDYKVTFCKKYPDYTDEDMHVAMLDYNNTLLAKIKEKLNSVFLGTVVIIGVKITEDSESKFSELSEEHLGDLITPKYNGRFACYLDEYGDFICGEIRDDTSENYIYRYRYIKPSLPVELKTDFLRLLDLNCHNEAAIALCTERLGDFIGDILNMPVPSSKNVLD